MLIFEKKYENHDAIHTKIELLSDQIKKFVMNVNKITQ